MCIISQKIKFWLCGLGSITKIGNSISIDGKLWILSTQISIGISLNRKVLMK